mgnify:CR=1 FL=1
MKKRILDILGLLMVTCSLSGQDCLTNDSTGENHIFSSENVGSCLHIGDGNAFEYIPAPTDPLYTLNLVVVIAQDTNGNSPFYDNLVLDSTFFHQMVHDINNGDMNNIPTPAVANPNPTVTVSDSRIRFSFNSLLYVKRDKNFTGIWDTDDIINDLAPGIAQNNIVMVYNTGTIAQNNKTGRYGIVGGTTAEGLLVTFWNHDTAWHSDLIAHELGHCLGLVHTFRNTFADGDNLSDTPDDIYVTSASGCAPAPVDCGCPPVTPYPGNVCPDNYMGYNQRHYWSPLQVGIMRRTAVEELSHLMVTPPSVNQDTSSALGWREITQNETWDTPRSIDSNIRVKTGNTLTITSSLGLKKEAVIEVEPGAFLNLSCSYIYGKNGLWQGIRVLGDNTKEQNSTWQGTLDISNSVITNATDAIMNGNIWSCAVTPSGGIIDVDSSLFYNNLRDIALVKYEPSQAWGHWLADWVDYKAEFSNTRFVKDQRFENPNNLYRGASISLWGVHGVKFNDCEVLMPNADFRDSSAMPVDGIYLLDATAQIDKSEIYFYTYGLRSFNSKPIFRGSKITETQFRHNRYGVFFSGGHRHQTFKNRFYVPKDDPINLSGGAVDIPYGVYYHQAGDFAIEENLFFNTNNSIDNFSNGSNATRAGIAVNNNGDFSDVLYGNYFPGMVTGIQTIGQNRDATGQLGLQCKCNDFVATHTDIFVKGTQGNSLDGIRENQGSLTAGTPADSNMAGNLFASGSNHIWDFKNENSPQVNYHHHNKANNPNVEAIPSQGVLNFNNNLSYNSNSCPTRLLINTEGDTLPEWDYPFANATADFADFTTGGDSLEGVLSQLIDGGNTFALQGEIYFTPQNEYFELYNNLLDESPYLSDTVLADIIMLEDMDDLMLRNLLVANPQAAKDEDLMELLSSYHPDMPQYMVDDIMAGTDVFGAKELVEANLSYHRQRQHFAATRLLDIYVNDNNYFSEAETEVRKILRQLRTPSFQYMRAQMELELGNVSKARQVVDSVPQLCTLNNDEALLHARAESYFDLQFALADNGLSVCGYNASQIQSLQNLASGDHAAGAWSRGALEILGQVTTYQEPLYLPGSSTSKRSTAHAYPQLPRPQHRIFPNPTQREVSVQLAELPLAEKLEVQLYDLSGALLQKQVLQGAQTRLSLAGIAPGTYVVAVFADEKRIFEEKLIVLE